LVKLLKFKRENKIKELQVFQKKFQETCESKNVIFLDGYKERAFSTLKVDKIGSQDSEGTFFRDPDTGLPFGLVEISIVQLF
jgi:hypothetical protein